MAALLLSPKAEIIAWLVLYGFVPLIPLAVRGLFWAVGGGDVEVSEFALRLVCADTMPFHAFVLSAATVLRRLRGLSSVGVMDLIIVIILGATVLGALLLLACSYQFPPATTRSVCVAVILLVVLGIAVFQCIQELKKQS